MSTTRVASGERVVGGTVLVAVVVGALVALITVALAVDAGEPVRTTLVVGLWVLAVGSGIARALRGRHRLLALAFLTACVLLLTIPAEGNAGIVLLIIATAVAAMDLGLLIGGLLDLVVVTAVMLGLVVDVQDDLGLVAVIGQAVLVFVVLAMATLVGRLVARLEDARARIAVANESLRRSLSLERELVLAEERARSARELHDGLGHRLTLIAMTLEFSRRVRDRDPDRAWREIDAAADTTRAALEEMRLWARALAPLPVADASGFEAIAAAFRGTGLSVTVEHRGSEAPLGRDAGLVATRVVQEALTNVVRHSGARRVGIEVLQSPGQVRLTIGDDGRGMSEEREGFGLRSLRERAELIGGRLTTGRSPLGGLELVAVIPIRAEC